MLEMARVWSRLAEYAAKTAARKECVELEPAPPELTASKVSTLGEGQKSECASA
jgi:hypothetical protein